MRCLSDRGNLFEWFRFLRVHVQRKRSWLTLTLLLAESAAKLRSIIPKHLTVRTTGDDNAFHPHIVTHPHPAVDSRASFGSVRGRKRNTFPQRK